MSTPTTPPSIQGDQGAASSDPNPASATDLSLVAQSGPSNATVTPAADRDCNQLLPELIAPHEYSDHDEDYRESEESEEYDDESEEQYDDESEEYDEEDEDHGDDESEDIDGDSEMPDQEIEEDDDVDGEAIFTTPPSDSSIRTMRNIGTSTLPTIPRRPGMSRLSGTMPSTATRAPAPMPPGLSMPNLRSPAVPRINLPPVPVATTTTGRLDLIVANAQLSHLTRRLSRNSQPIIGESNGNLAPPAPRNPASTTHSAFNPALHPPGYPLPDSRRAASGSTLSPSFSYYRERYNSLRRSAEEDIRAGLPIPTLDSVAGQQRRRAVGARVTHALHDQRRNASLESPARPTPLEVGALSLESECKVCFTQIADTLLLPCCHLVLCRWCAEQIGAQQEGGGGVAGTCCPVCRAPVEDRLLVYRG